MIDQLTFQLDRPFHGDRNKAIYNLLEIAQKFPNEREYLKKKSFPMIRYIAETSVLMNVRDPAIQLRDILLKDER